jgi:hypothetical protein
VIGVVTGDITYAEVEIVRFMKPKVRTRHQRPKNTLTRTPFGFEIWNIGVEILNKVTNANGVVTIGLACSTGIAA